MQTIQFRNETPSDPRTIPSLPLHRLLSVAETAELLGVSRSWLQKTRTLGGGPVAIVIGRRVLYAPADIQTWLETRKRRDTSHRPERDESKSAEPRSKSVCTTSQRSLRSDR